MFKYKQNLFTLFLGIFFYLSIVNSSDDIISTKKSSRREFSIDSIGMYIF